MQLFKNILLRLLSFCLLSTAVISACRAQGTFAVAGPKGIWVICGDLLPRNFSYKISRKSAKTDWVEVANLKMPASKEQIKAELMITQRKARMPVEILPEERLNELAKRVLPVANKNYPFEIKDDYPIRCAISTAWYDATADSLSQYQYRVQMFKGDEVNGEEVTNAVSYPGAHFDARLKPVFITPVKGGVNAEFEVVDKSTMTHCKVYRSYYLRSGFQEIEASPLFISRDKKLFISFSDKTAVDKVPYTYVIVPVDAAGNTGTQSPEVRVFDVPEKTIVASITNFKTTSVEDKKAIKLSWRLPKTQRVTSLDIYKSADLNGKYVKIASVGPADTTYFDLDVLPITTYYYSIQINGVYQSSPFSARAPGILRASTKNLFPPRDLQLHQNGRIITLTFEKPAADIHAYYIYRATGKDGVFQQIGKPVITSQHRIAYVDTLPPVSQPTIFTYAVADENTSYNISPKTPPVYAYYGGIVQLPIPHDVIVRKMDDNKLQVIWPDMRKESKTILGYMLYRRSRSFDGKETPVQPVTAVIIKPSENHYTDSLVTDGMAYYYTLRTVGEDGKIYSSPSLEAGYTIQPDIPGPVANIRVFADGNTVALSWNNPLGQQTKSIKIYRALQGQKPVEIATLPATEEAYSDKDVKTGNIYYYSFIIINNKGRSSNVTPPVGIHLK